MNDEWHPHGETSRAEEMKSMSKTWEIWAEGYAVTGMSSSAQLLDRQDATTFDEAVTRYVSSLPPDQARYFRQESDGAWFYWGCQLYPTEAEARKSFG